MAGAEFAAFVTGMLEPLGGVSARRMFGGHGIFAGGVMFALIADEQLYFRVDERTREQFEAEDCAPFSYRRTEGERKMHSYYTAPERLLDDADELLEWGQAAMDAAFRNDALKKKPRKKQG